MVHFYYEGLNAHEHYEIVRKAIRHNGPTGMFELDDGENWGESTRGNVGIVTRSRPLNYSMNVGKGNIIRDEGGPPHIEALVNEHGQMWRYTAWAEWMTGSWG